MSGKGRRIITAPGRNGRFSLWKDDHFLASQGKKMDKATAKKFLKKGKVHYKDLVSKRTGKSYEATVEMVLTVREKHSLTCISPAVVRNQAARRLSVFI